MLSLPLIHVQNDSHWETVCKTTPFHSDNNTYFPMECENKASLPLCYFFSDVRLILNTGRRRCLGTSATGKGPRMYETGKDSNSSRSWSKLECSTTWFLFTIRCSYVSCICFFLVSTHYLSVGAYSTILLKYSYDDYWQEACETTELLFDGRNLTSPAKCELVVCISHFFFPLMLFKVTWYGK